MENKFGVAIHALFECSNMERLIHRRIELLKQQRNRAKDSRLTTSASSSSKNNKRDASPLFDAPCPYAKQHITTMDTEKVVYAVTEYGMDDDGRARSRNFVSEIENQRDDASTRQQKAPRKHFWTTEEDSKLKELVVKYGTSNWSQVAREMPHRDRKRCRERYINHLDPKLHSRAWTSEEDAKLESLRREMGTTWASIARQFDGRSPDDVKNRCIALSIRNNLPPDQIGSGSSIGSPPAKRRKVSSDSSEDDSSKKVREKLTWSAWDDNVLRTKVDEFGHKWSKVASFLPGRTGKQCRERYLNYVDPSLVKTEWSPDEDARLYEAYDRHPKQWKRISEELPRRSVNSIKNRWHLLMRLSTQEDDSISGDDTYQSVV